ncbi:MAG TPA: hypothetical protein DEQ02_10245 [Ruminococcaceae bacterium]|nr:hypothetical protein [Oscillospiraceae bacterium]
MVYLNKDFIFYSRCRMSVYTGEYFKHVSDDALRAVYYTFTPKPLTGGDHYSIDEELCALLVETHRALGVLEGMSMYIADNEIIRELMLLQECHYSRQIDYEDSDLHSLLKARGNGRDFSAIKNMMNAYRQSVEFPVAIGALSAVCRTALHGAESTEDVDIRSNPIFITKAVTNLRQYNPTAPKDIRPSLIDIAQYWKQDNSDVLVKAALAHYQFEMIHPFDCYNGIVGRILISKALLSSHLNASHFLCPSLSLYNAKNDYFGILASTQRSGGYLLWIKFFIRSILDAAKRASGQIQDYQRITQYDKEKIRAHKASTENTLLLYDYFKEYLVSGIPRPAEVLHLTHATVSNAIKLLQESGILRQSSIGSRNRTFMYSELIDILSIDTESRY